MTDEEYIIENFELLSPALQEVARIIGIEPKEKIIIP